MRGMDLYMVVIRMLINIRIRSDEKAGSYCKWGRIQRARRQPLGVAWHGCGIGQTSGRGRVNRVQGGGQGVTANASQRVG